MTDQTAVHRFEVCPLRTARDPAGEALMREAAGEGVELTGARTSRVYLIEAELTEAQRSLIAERLLCDPVTETIRPDAAPPLFAGGDGRVIEVHPLAGVMDPAGLSVASAIRDLIGAPARVSTGVRYDIEGPGAGDARRLAERLLANPLIHAVHEEPFRPGALPKGSKGSSSVTRIPVRDLSDNELSSLSRDAHLFLSLDEMITIREEFRTLEREPTDIELETLAQTWSEHCVHKTLKATVRYRPAGGDDPIEYAGRPGHRVMDDGTILIENLLASTVAAATHELMADGVDWALSVFVDNAGVIRFDDEHAVCVKVETHNHPSALEPYGGAATGIGGCIRDIIGTGLGADPIASTDVFCVARADIDEVPSGCLHPRRILTKVMEGVRDYGNRMGIPTVAGAVTFDDRYVGNPLVFCGCVGVMPADRIRGVVGHGDLIVALGGRTGRDGIHGATFSSAELTDTHADEFSHAVQIGNPVEEKRVLDAILLARDEPGGPLFTAITDCGAGGFSSAVGEMGEQIGAAVDLERAPLKYDGLTYTEIWISEAQERMVLAVPSANLDRLRAICDEEGVEIAVLGQFGTEGSTLELRHEGQEVGRLPMAFLHDGLPKTTREAVSPLSGRGPVVGSGKDTRAPRELLLALLADPDIASKHWIIRQYDHEVKGNTVIKPLVGPHGVGPSDASVVQPVAGSKMGLAIACGLRTGIGDPEAGGDPYEMAVAGIDECVRNLVCAGARPDRIAILDNFCWPSCNDAPSMGSLVRACEGCYDGAKAYRTPFVSGKDSLNNQFTTDRGTTIRIPPTLLITGVGVVDDIARCVTTDAKRAGNILLAIGVTTGGLTGSRLAAIAPDHAGLTSVALGSIPRVDLSQGPRTAVAVADAIRDGHVASAHDVSDGGIACAVGEMLIGSWDPGRSLGATIDLSGVHTDPLTAAFGESGSRYVIEASPEAAGSIERMMRDAGVSCVRIGGLDTSGALSFGGASVDVATMVETWRHPLAWDETA